MDNLFSYRFYLIILCTAFSLNSHAQEDKIKWEEDLEFSWDLFKEKRSSYSYIKAMTYSGISYEVDVEMDQVIINTEAYFIYGKSWVMKGFKKPHLLKHEKMHFHIAEIYKRKLDLLAEEYRVSYDEFVQKDFQKKLQRDFDKTFDEMDRYQMKYDNETEHGINKSAQLDWERKINKMLQ